MRTHIGQSRNRINKCDSAAYPVQSFESVNRGVSFQLHAADRIVFPHWSDFQSFEQGQQQSLPKLIACC